MKSSVIENKTILFLQSVNRLENSFFPVIKTIVSKITLLYKKQNTKFDPHFYIRHKMFFTNHSPTITNSIKKKNETFPYTIFQPRRS